MGTFPHYTQLDQMDCGPTCLQMIAKHYGKTYTIGSLRKKSFITREGVSLLGISDAAEAIGFRTLGVKINYHQLVTEAPLRCVVYWYQRHFIVVYKIAKDKVFVADPSSNDVKLIIGDKDLVNMKGGITLLNDNNLRNFYNSDT